MTVTQTAANSMDELDDANRHDAMRNYRMETCLPEELVMGTPHCLTKIARQLWKLCEECGSVGWWLPKL